jgi:hypothetical protein
MGSRRLAREQALQLLYQVDLTDSETEGAIGLFWRTEPADPDVVEFAQALVRGVGSHRDRIDELITAASINWSISSGFRSRKGPIRPSSVSASAKNRRASLIACFSMSVLSIIPLFLPAKADPASRQRIEQNL